MTTSSQLTRFQFLYEQMLNKLNTLNMDVYILSDSNLNLLKFADHAPTNHHIDSQLENKFIQLISKPTRVDGAGKASLLDHITTNRQQSSLTNQCLST